MSQYNYIVTAFESNSIIGTLKVDLFGDGIYRLLVIKTKCIEIYEFDTNGLDNFVERSDEEIVDFSILRTIGKIETYKSVLDFDKWRPRHQNFDDIAILTKEYELMILRAHLLDSGNEKVLHFNVMDSISLYRENLRKSELVKMMVNAEKQRIVVFGYEGCLQIVGSELNNKDGDSKTRFLSPIIFRITESCISDICLVTTSNERTLMVVIYDSGYDETPRLMRTTELPVDIKKWTSNSNLGLIIDNRISKMIPFYDRTRENKVIRGFFLFGDGIVEYKPLEEVLPNKLKDNEAIKEIRAYFSSGRFNAVGISQVQMSITGVIALDNSSKWLIMDSMGRLLMMIVSFDETQPNKVLGMKIKIIKKFAPFSKITQLENDLFFVSSILSDSMVISIRKNKLYILDIISNIGPIKDMFFTNNQTINKITKETEYGGNTSDNPISLISACGFGEYGSLKSICNGIALQRIYFQSRENLKYFTRLFSVNEYNLVCTNVNETRCFGIKWTKNDKSTTQEPVSKKEKGLNTDFDSELKIFNSEERLVLDFEEFDLPGLEKRDETIKIFAFENKYWFQVTQKGVFSLGSDHLNKKYWLLTEYIEACRENIDIESEFIEKCDHCTLQNILIMTTSSGLLLVCKFDKDEILRVLYRVKKEELFRSIDNNFKMSLESNQEKINETSLLGNFIYKSIDEVSILKILSLDKYTFVFISTWMNGNRLFCFCFDNTLINEFEMVFFSGIETEFDENEIITALQVFTLDKKIECRNRKTSSQKFICLLIGTSNGFLQLRYLQANELTKNKFRKPDKVSSCDNGLFLHQNTWRVSNIYISDIKELLIYENLNRYFFICSDQPKIIFWSHNIGRDKQDLGIWSFYNIHSSWIQSICQMNLPNKPIEDKGKSPGRKTENGNSTHIFYVNYEGGDEVATLSEEKDSDFIANKEKQTSWLKLGIINTFQRYNCRNIPLNFTPEKICYIDNLRIYAVVGIIETSQIEERNMKNKRDCFQSDFSENFKESNFFNEPKIIKTILCLISGTDFEVKYVKFLEENVYPTCIKYVRMRATGDLESVKCFLALGLSKVKGFNKESPKVNNKQECESLGRIVLYEIDIKDKKVVGLNEAVSYETPTSPFVISEFKKRLLLVSVENTIICFELISILPTNNTISSSCDFYNEESQESTFVLKERGHYSTHTMIVFIKIWNDELILVGDLMRSVGLLEFDRNSGLFQEICRDTSVAWVIDGMFFKNNMYLVSDENKNLRILMRDLNPTNDEALTTMSSIAHFHVGESVTTFQRGNFMTVYPETKKLQDDSDLFGNCLTRHFLEDQVMFGTSQGGIYTIFSIKSSSSVFAQLISIEEAIIETIKNGISQLELDRKVINLKEKNLRHLFVRNSNSSSFTGVSSVLGSKDSVPFRWKLNESCKNPYNFEYECSGTPRGFALGDVIESYLDLSIEMQKQVLVELKRFVSKRKLKVPETVQEMETIIEQLKNMH